MSKGTPIRNTESKKNTRLFDVDTREDGTPIAVFKHDGNKDVITIKNLTDQIAKAVKVHSV